MEQVDVALVGGGAAGLMAAVQAARHAGSGRSVVVLDGARRLGAKILVSGGGRCNVTHEAVVAEDFCGSTPKAIGRILRRFGVAETVAFFDDLGVALKREPSGKLFPVTDRAATVLEALLRAAAASSVDLRHPWRVGAIEPVEGGFRLNCATEGREPLAATRVILATGGKSLPKSGSDGFGHVLARRLGHTLTPESFPALVPLLLPESDRFTALSGLAFPARLEVRGGSGRRVAAVEGAILCTHFGLSGPAVLDVSRHFLHARTEDPASVLVLDSLPGVSRESLGEELRRLGAATVVGWCRGRLPERLGHAMLEAARVPFERTGAGLTREERRRLLASLKELELPVLGPRGFRFAEVTAGGVPLSELRLPTLESRRVAGLHLCGEICDVDGRLGGFNFQWAWASGFVAGAAAGAAARAS